METAVFHLYSGWYRPEHRVRYPAPLFHKDIGKNNDFFLTGYNPAGIPGTETGTKFFDLCGRRYLITSSNEFKFYFFISKPILIFVIHF
jgi:hypothetical protein